MTSSLRLARFIPFVALLGLAGFLVAGWWYGKTTPAKAIVPAVVVVVAALLVDAWFDVRGTSDGDVVGREVRR